MKRFHLIFGFVVIIIFILTGQYMDKFLQHLDGMADGPRLMYRTRHIYILLSGLLNLAVGAYFSYRATRRRRLLQFAGSALIVAATALFIIGFFWEPKLAGLETPLVRSRYLPHRIRHPIALLQRVTTHEMKD